MLLILNVETTRETHAMFRTALAISALMIAITNPVPTAIVASLLILGTAKGNKSK